MALIHCDCSCRCHTTALVTSLLIGVVGAFLRITGVLYVNEVFLWAAFAIAVAYLAVLVLASARLGRSEPCECMCVNLSAVLVGILGTILLAVVLLLVGVASIGVIGAILIGLLLFFLALMLTGTACFVRCALDCGN